MLQLAGAGTWKIFCWWRRIVFFCVWKKITVLDHVSYGTVLVDVISLFMVLAWLGWARVALSCAVFPYSFLFATFESLFLASIDGGGGLVDVSVRARKVWENKPTRVLEKTAAAHKKEKKTWESPQWKIPLLIQLWWPLRGSRPTEVRFFPEDSSVPNESLRKRCKWASWQDQT